MKRFYFHKALIVCFLALFSISLSAQVYVKHDASGSNDGTSWDNAYTDLGTALQNVSSGDVWVSAGTYRHSDSDTTSTWRVTGAISLLGGFAGTETNVEERDPAANVTILTGDVNGDDTAGDFMNNRSDNVRHVLYVDSLLVDPTTIDGFTISGGNTSDNADVGLWHRAGAGVFSYSPLVVNDCHFEDNFGRSGAGVYLIDGASGSSFSNSIYNKNRSTAQAGGIMANGLADITVSNCDFTENTVSRGAMYPLRCSNVLIEDCLFQDNVNPGGFGGAFFAWNSVGLTVNNCEFIDNTAGYGGGAYIDGRESPIDPTNNVFTNCNFIGSASTAGSGGCLSVFSASITIDNCTFENSSSSASAGHINFFGQDKIVNVQNTSFENASIGGWGGAMTCYGENSTFNLVNNVYRGNICQNLGGAFNAGFTAVVNVEDCLFESNEAGSGGAICLQNDSTTVNVINSEFLGNMASGNGGGINGIASHWITVEDCLFEGNTANFGAGININEGTSDVSTLDVSNCFFNFNFADSQAGAINVTDANATITNCVMLNNSATDPGTGGAISVNAGDSSSVEVFILNTSIAENIGAVAAGLAAWEDNDTSAFANITLQNVIFDNLGSNYAIEAGTPNINSNGGNLSADGSLEPYLTHAQDLNNEDPKFVDPDDFDLHLQEGSPCINAGVADGAPLLDFEGNERILAPEMGAYEYYGVDATKETVIENAGLLNVFPNPTGQLAQFKIDNNWNGVLKVTVFNQLGQRVQSLKLVKNSNILEHTLDLGDLPKGNYEILVSNGHEALVQQIVKM